MTVRELALAADAEFLTGDTARERSIATGYVCDLLSWVMARGQKDCAWITVQTHMNVVAVAALHDMACIVLPENIRMEEAPLQKAVEEGIAVLSSPLTAYEICRRMAEGGVPSPERA